MAASSLGLLNLAQLDRCCQLARAGWRFSMLGPTVRRDESRAGPELALKRGDEEAERARYRWAVTGSDLITRNRSTPDMGCMPDMGCVQSEILSGPWK